MTRLEISRGGAFTTLQDLGRFGAQALGVPVSGALDPVALRLANALVGNPGGTAALEIRLLGPKFTVEGGPVRVALVGTDTPLALGSGRMVPAGQSVTLAPGETLDLASTPDTGVCYLAIAGGIDRAPQFGSLSTYAPAGLGAPLAAGEQLPLVGPALDGPERRLRAQLPGRGPIRVVLGPQDSHFTRQAIQTFLSAPYRVGALNRMGLRLSGAALTHSKGHNIPSDGIVTGAIQVPGDGQPIILLADRQTTGGYPKIASVISADLPRLGRLTQGAELSFEAVDVPTAETLRRKQEAEIERMIAQIEPVPTSPDDLSAILMRENLISGVVGES